MVGRATCALAFEELALPTSGIDHDTENSMGSCYIAAERAMFRMELIDKDIEGGTSAMDAILAYDAKVPSERNNINEEFASCQKALPELKRDMKLILELDYPIKAAGLVAGRRKREGMEALETAGSLVWPEENLEEKAQSLSDQTSFRAKRKAEAERAIRELQR